MELFGFELTLSLTQMVMLGVFFVSFIHQVYFYFRYINGVLRYNSKIKKGKISFVDSKPPVSIIICAKDESENIKNFLPSVLEQDYPQFEVILINDGSSDDTEEVLKNFRAKYKHLKTTFVPAEANNLSTKKLGITLGVKAAKYDWLVFTDADCQPVSQNWISQLARNFKPDVEFVLGYGGYFSQGGFVNKLINYDTLFIALQYLGMASLKQPYMGVGRNLVYRKQTFFNQKGFASMLHLASGDDDLMVNKAANGRNTAIEINPESVTLSVPNKTYKGWLYQKARHLSVSNYYSLSSKLRISSEPMTRAMFYLAFIALMFVGNLEIRAVGVCFFLVRFVSQAFIINKSAKHFGSDRRFISTLLLFDIFLPLVTLFIFISNRFKPNRNYKWR
jgi:cellulose synthase/poly-beta-1,6-N-acetylglucosamine synthase-like glycosyltransferase